MLGRAMFNHTTIPVLEQVVNFAQMRHGILAGNIANIDTPGYQTADLSPQQFEAKLKSALESRDAPQTWSLGNTPTGGPVGESMNVLATAGNESDPLREVSASLNSILYHDESNVSLEHQVTEISKNHAMHNLALTILNQQFRQLEVAISERVI